MTNTLPTYDKSNWSRGEWDNEPDRVDFIHSGFSCFILRNTLGSWCGYVGVPETHSCFGKDYDNVDVDIHGGLTYSAKCYGHICHTPKAGMPDKVWWLGFDTAHAWDISPGLNINSDGTYKNMNYAITETKKLADQLGHKK